MREWLKHGESSTLISSSGSIDIIIIMVHVYQRRRFVRSQIIFANTMFHAVCYRPDECQIITAGTDRKIGYWETYDGSQIRELDGSKSASINGMDIYGKHFITGGGDRLIKVCLCYVCILKGQQTNQGVSLLCVCVCVCVCACMFRYT